MSHEKRRSWQQWVEMGWGTTLLPRRSRMGGRLGGWGAPRDLRMTKKLSLKPFFFFFSNIKLSPIQQDLKLYAIIMENRKFKNTTWNSSAGWDGMHSVRAQLAVGVHGETTQSEWEPSQRHKSPHLHFCGPPNFSLWHKTFFLINSSWAQYALPPCWFSFFSLRAQGLTLACCH